mgnify:CR=1 FL=1
MFAARGKLQNLNILYIETEHGATRYTYSPDIPDCRMTIEKPQLSCLPGFLFRFFFIDLQFRFVKSVDSASFLFSSYFGDSDKQFLTDTWIFSNAGTLVHATFSRETCFPFMQIDYAQQPGKKRSILFSNSTKLLFFLFFFSLIESVTTAIISDFVPTIVDPSIFDIPPLCRYLI